MKKRWEKRVYAIPNKRISDRVAQLTEARVETLGLKATAEAFLELCQPEEDPLHDQFEWNDARAGHLYRLTTARSLMRSYEVRLVDLETGEERSVGGTVSVPVRLLHSKDDEAGEKGTEAEVYLPQEAVLADERLSAFRLNELRSELRSLNARYKDFREAACERSRGLQLIFEGLGLLEDEEKGSDSHENEEPEPEGEEPETEDDQ